MGGDVGFTQSTKVPCHKLNRPEMSALERCILEVLHRYPTRSRLFRQSFSQVMTWKGAFPFVLGPVSAYVGTRELVEPEAPAGSDAWIALKFADCFVVSGS